jgi:hypothetical protein
LPKVNPSIITSPPSDFRRVPIILIVVDFPAPFGPKKANKDPFST